MNCSSTPSSESKPGKQYRPAGLPRLVDVCWNDPVCNAGWIDDPVAATPTQCWTVGYLLYADESKIVLAATADFKDRCYADVSVIPLGCVVGLRPLSDDSEFIQSESEDLVQLLQEKFP